MIKAIALDDEPLALEIIQNYSKKIKEIDLINVFTSQKNAVQFIEENDVDLIFLDIEMPECNGINLYNSLNKKIIVIFTTAYKKYAIDAFNINAVDYLLKPFSLERYKVSIEKANIQLNYSTKKITNQTHLDIKADYQLHHIPFKKILMIEAFDDYIKINLTENTKIVTRYTMKSILMKLPKNQFARVHRSYIIALDKITSIHRNKVSLGKLILPVSITYKNDLLEKIKN